MPMSRPYSLTNLGHYTTRRESVDTPRITKNTFFPKSLLTKTENNSTNDFIIHVGKTRTKPLSRRSGNRARTLPPAQKNSGLCRVVRFAGIRTPSSSWGERLFFPAGTFFLLGFLLYWNEFTNRFERFSFYRKRRSV